ncbi:uncharacterized protein LOC124807812 [Hydra vulgaris]|uniref:uncharacterized protein LOC124807812 n=2 Tax=Hydra vulgaris TaxID=6087 RepID=UPI001F5E46DE|nr:uncharacterized protein LOC124807812 [Hydra vulgaris]
MDQDLMHLLSNDQKDYIFLALREFSDNLKHSDFTFKVLVPEAILYLFAELEGISRNKAEVLLSSYSSQRTNELVNKLPDEDDAFSADKNLVAGSKELLNGSADFSENENSSNKESSQIAQPVLEKEEKQPQYFYNFITYLTENIYPPGLGKNDKRTFRSVAKKYCVQDGKLKRKVTVCGNSVYADVIMDTEERLKIFTLEHDSPLGGHSGQTKTKAKIMEKYYWPNISGDIIKWVKQCKRCQTSGQLISVSEPLHSIKTTRVWEIVGIDFAGPFTETSMGNRYFMSCTDLFSKWPVAYALPNKEALTVAKSIIKLVTTFGFPSVILSDNGSEFCNELNNEMYRLLGIERRKTAVYHPQTNGQDENTNKNIKRKIRKLIDENQSNWDEFLDVVLYPLRVERQTSTKVSPFEIMFGGRLPVFSSELKEEIIVLGPTEEEVIVEVEKNRNHVENLTNLISKNIKDAQAKQKKYYDARVQKNCKVSADPIMVGDKVLLLDIRGRRSKGAAFKPRFKGPYYVAHITKCGNFKLNDLNNIPLKSTHKKLHIKKFIESLEKGDILMEYLCQIKPIKAVMGIYSSLGGCKIYDYSLHDALNGCLSDEVVYVYLRLLASDQKKYRIEVLAPAGLLSLEELPHPTDLIRRKHVNELFKLDILICCVVLNFHWKLTIIKPREKIILYINPLGETKASILKEEKKWNSYLMQRYSVIEKFELVTLPHALQTDNISCGVFCLKFAENYINESELALNFPLEDVIEFRKKVVHLLMERGGQRRWQDKLCRICGNERGPSTQQIKKSDKWIKCANCIPNRWFHMECIDYAKETSDLFTCSNVSLSNICLP